MTKVTLTIIIDTRLLADSVKCWNKAIDSILHWVNDVNCLALVSKK